MQRIATTRWFLALALLASFASPGNAQFDLSEGVQITFTP